MVTEKRRNMQKKRTKTMLKTNALRRQTVCHRGFPIKVNSLQRLSPKQEKRSCCCCCKVWMKKTLSMVMHLLLYYAQVLGCVCSSYTQPCRHDQRTLSQAKMPALASEFVLNQALVSTFLTIKVKSLGFDWALVWIT